ncbi:MAG: hypothetical protein RQ723_12990 [Desulfuromonadales bacterium]|nr:hypothetical protein [Desulfuromonadales bacterium]
MRSQQRDWLPALVVLIVSSSFLIACTHQMETGSENSDSTTELADIMSTVERFWAAAATEDESAMRREATGATPIDWVKRWRQAYPTFFKETVGKLEIVAAYAPTDEAATIEVLIEVPWVSCPPPAHDGKRDRFHVHLIPVDSSWRVVEVWKDIC